MNVELAEELLNALGSSLESLETQQTALIQFLKDQGIVTDEQLASYLTQAGKASSVRWRAARVRLEYLISAEKGREEKAAEKEKHDSGGEQAAGHDPEKQGPEKQDSKKEDQDKEDQKKEDQQKDGQKTESQEDKGQKKEGQEKEAKAKNDEGSKSAPPQPEKDGNNAAGQGAGAQSNSEKDKK